MQFRDGYIVYVGFPGVSVVGNPLANEGDVGSMPGSGRSLEEGNGNLLRYSCLGNPMDRVSWRVTVHAVARVGRELVTKQQQILYVQNIEGLS